MGRLQRTSIIVLLLILTIGFASVATYVIITNNVTLGFNEEDFKVIFTSASAYNGNVEISNDSTTINYNSELLSFTGDYSIISYTVTNTSLLFDANISLNITDLLGNNITSDYFTITETKQLPSTLGGTSSAEGEIKIELITTPLDSFQYNFKVTIEATPIERTNTELISGDDAPGAYNDDGNILLSWNEMVNTYGLDVENGTVTLNDVLSSKTEYQWVTNIVVPEGVTYINENVFQDVQGLTEITLPSTFDGYTTGMFSGSRELANINVSENNPNYSSIDGVLFDKEQKTLILYPEGKGTKRYTIPNTVETLDTYSLFYASFSSLTIPASVKRIETNAFYNTSITNLYFDNDYNWYVDDIAVNKTDISTSTNAKTFISNHHGTWINSSVAGLYDDNGIFLYSWETITKDYGVDFEDKIESRLSNDNYRESDFIYWCYEDADFCSGTKLIMGDDITYIGQYSLAYTHIKEVVLSNTITSIHDSAFMRCDDLVSVKLSNTLTDIGNGSFGSTPITNIELPASLATIGKGAFQYTNLTSVTFENPNGWKYESEVLSASDLSDPTIAANYLKTIKIDKAWTRS